MAISVNELLEEKARRYGASPFAGDFQQKIVDAINYTLDDIDERLGLSTARVDATTDSISLDEQEYRGILSFGMDVHLANDGQWEVKSLKDLEARYERKLSFVHMNYLRSVDLEARFGDVDA